MSGKKYIVTGGDGFIGSHIVSTLRDRGDEVVIIDKSNDIRDLSQMEALIKGSIDGIFHCAAIVSVQYSLDNPRETEEVNVEGTRNILKLAEKKGIRRVVFSSSCAVYGDSRELPTTETAKTQPISPYAKQKLMNEVDILEFTNSGKGEAVILRYFNVYGPGQKGDSPYSGVIARFLQLKSQGQPLTIYGDGKQSRDFVYVGDVVRANLIAMEMSGISGEIFNIGSGRSTTINDLAEIVGGEITHLPARNEIRHSLADISKAKRILNWSAEIKINDGLQALL